MGQEQHFVSQFYLRRFSHDDCSVNLLNLKREQIVYGASIAGQCKKRGLYNFHPDIEGALGDLEGVVATILRRVDATGELPPADSEDAFSLKYFILMQKVRTAGSGRAADEMTDFFAKQYFTDNSELEKNGLKLSNMKIGSKYPTALSMQIISENAHRLVDFDLHLFANKSRNEFITSDNPAVAHNAYCEGITYRGVLGIGCSGYQIILPISARALLMMYDKDVYTVGATRRSTMSVIVEKAEVELLNAFQILNAEHNIYFSADEAGRDALNQLRKLRAKREQKRLVFVTTKPVEETEETERSILHHYERLLPLEMKLREFGVRRRKRPIPIEMRARDKLRRDKGAAPDGSESERWKTYKVEKIETR